MANTAEITEKEVSFEVSEYSEFYNQIATVRDLCNFIPDMTTDEGYNKSKRVALDVGKILTKLEKVRKDKKSFFIEGGRQVDSQAKSIAAELEEARLPHKEAYKALDGLVKERERKRKEELENRVEHLRTLPQQMADSCSDEVLTALQYLQKEECLDFFEFTQLALMARNDSRKSLQEMYTRKLKEEKDAEELKRLREEQARREQQEREDRIRKEATEKAEREKAEAIAREKEAKRMAEEAAKREAEARAMAEQRAKEAAEQSRLDEIARQEREAQRVKEEQERREANKKHVGNIRREAKEDLMTLGLSETQAKAIVLAVNNSSIRHISINY